MGAASNQGYHINVSNTIAFRKYTFRILQMSNIYAREEEVRAVLVEHFTTITSL